MTLVRRLALLALILAWPTVVVAGPSREDVAAADALFREGKQLLTAGKVEQACQKFEASQRLDPGVGTLLNLGNCFERLDRLASAWGAFSDAVSLARRTGDTAAEKEAARRVTALEPRVDRLEIVIDESARIDGLEIQRDGRAVDPGLLGSPIPLDPGLHTLTATAPGKEPWRHEVTLRGEGKTETVTVTAWWPTETVLPPPPPPRRSSRRLTGLIVGGVGAAALLGGTIAGLTAMSRWSDADPHCDDNTVCDQVGYDLVKGAQSAATWSNVLFGVGIAAVATGVVLYLTAPRPSAERAIAIDVVPMGDGALVTVGGGF